jgi:hypothetical protein
LLQIAARRPGQDERIDRRDGHDKDDNPGPQIEILFPAAK